jgi:hypothetical protein
MRSMSQNTSTNLSETWETKPEQMELFEANGRPVGTRTPDLYRVNYSRGMSTFNYDCYST